MRAFLDKLDTVDPAFTISVVILLILLVAFILVIRAAWLREKSLTRQGIDKVNLDLEDPPKRKRPLTDAEVKEIEQEASDLISMQGSQF